MYFVVISVAFVVYIFSFFYLTNDPHISRFFIYLLLFTFFMLLLIVGDNLLLIFWGWEGVGLCSFLLINFWYSRINANKAALKAVFINKISDLFLFFGIVLIINEVNTLEVPVFFSLVPFLKCKTILIAGFSFNFLNLLSFLFLGGVVGKSAQIGLHIWLPDAMEGPTPVSALIHAATMVTAGVFLLIRFSVLFEYCPKTLKLIIFLGCFTSLVSALIGSFQYDVKKIIAYSTCSQLGYMVVSCGLSNYILGLFHLVNHAFFKALLFLSSGLLIFFSGEQDIRKYNFFFKKSPLLFLFFLIPSLSLCGFPFLSGAFSKELILQFSKINFLIDGNFVYNILIFSAVLTTFYSSKLFFYIFYKKPKLSKRLKVRVVRMILYLYPVVLFIRIESVDNFFEFLNEKIKYFFNLINQKIKFLFFFFKQKINFFIYICKYFFEFVIFCFLSPYWMYWTYWNNAWTYFWWQNPFWKMFPYRQSMYVFYWFSRYFFVTGPNTFAENEKKKLVLWCSLPKWEYFKFKKTTNLFYYTYVLMRWNKEVFFEDRIEDDFDNFCDKINIWIILKFLKILSFLKVIKNFNNSLKINLKLNFWYSLNNLWKTWLYIPLLFLFFLSIISGYFLTDIFLGIGSNFFSEIIFINPSQKQIFFEKFFEIFSLKFLPIILSFLIFFLFENFNQFFKKFKKFYYFFKLKIYFDFIFNFFFLFFYKLCYFFILKKIDGFFLQFLGPLGIIRFFYFLSFNLNKFNLGLFFNYFCFFIFFFIIFLLF